MNREDFPILKDNKLIYFDNGATSLKPKCVVDEVVSYYNEYTANAHRGDYKNSLIVDRKYEEVRNKVKNLINAKSSDEIVFTSGTTESLNMIAFGFMRNHLNFDDEVLITKAEHASNILPWHELAKEIGIKVRYIPLKEDYSIDYDYLNKMINEKTKVISLASVTNVVGDNRDLFKIGTLAKEHNIYFVVDGAQSMPHKKIDVIKNNISFLAFSSHKMLGPTGVGVLYGKYELLDKLKPLKVGGGMNQSFSSDGKLEYKMLPSRLEAGTPNIAGVLGFGRAIDYLEGLGFDKILEHEKKLKSYLITGLKEIPNIKVYNEDSDSSIVIFNINDVFAQDTAVYLDHYNICVRAGNHCAKILKDELGVKNTCRISLYFYNTKEEIDKLLEVLRNAKDIFEVVI